MKERQILFRAPSVRGILDGSKTQDRRIVKPQPEPTPDDYPGPKGHWWPCHAVQSMVHVEMELQNKSGVWGGFAQTICPYGQPGDRLWVREAWLQRGRWQLPSWPEAEYDDAYWSGTKEIEYAADGAQKREGWRMRPSIHMPRWASRITLEITAVRVERLHDISEADALAEGIVPGKYLGLDRAAARAYSDLWEKNNGPGSWDANPWVWVVEFRRVA